MDGLPRPRPLPKAGGFGVLMSCYLTLKITLKAIKRNAYSLLSSNLLKGFLAIKISQEAFFVNFYPQEDYELRHR
jgi:hypothetical protein